MTLMKELMVVIQFIDRGRARAIGLTSGIVMLGAAIGGLPASAGSKSGDALPDVTLRPAQAERVRLVACLLPADVDRLGSQVTHLGARRQVQLTAEECAARGGEIEAEGNHPPPDDEPKS